MMKQEKLQIRDDFPMLEQKMHGHPLIYFDNAATTLKPRKMIEALTHFYANDYGTVHRSVYQLSERSTHLYYQSRQEVQKFIGARSSKEIIFTSGTTDSINKIAYSFSEAFLQKGDEILITELEHHSNLVPWQMVAEKYSATLKLIPVLESGDIDLDAFKELLNERTKIVAFAHVSNVTGAVHPAKQIIELIRARSNAKVMLDGAQAIAHMPINVQDLDVDFYVFSAHKIYGPTGVGVWYGKEELLEKMPPLFGGGDMIEKVTLKKTTYNQLPFKFEAGTPNIAGVIALKAAIEYVKEIGFDKIEEIELLLIERLISKLQKIPYLHFVGHPKNRSSLVGFNIDKIHPLDLATLLNFKGVAVRSGHLCAQPALEHFGISSMLRASLSFYNTIEEVDQFIDYLLQSIDKLKS